MPIDYSKYPPNWKTEIVPRILKRADNKCEFCGLENHSVVYSLRVYLRLLENDKYGFRSIWFRDQRDAKKHSHLGVLKLVKVVLTVAHLDHDAENFSVKDSRLRALCQQCHNQLDAKVKMQKIMLNNKRL